MKIFAGFIVLVVLVAISYSVFKGFPVGYQQGHLIIYKQSACADLCDLLNRQWYKSYYGQISYDECLSLGGQPKLVGFIQPGPGSIGGYDGCKVK